MEKSESIKLLAGALAQAQAEMPAVQFNATNPFLKNKYADLGAIISTSKPILGKNGLSVSQLVSTDNSNVGVTTVLMHNSGEWLESTAWLPVGEGKGMSQAQVAGSLITYLRRYSLASILGMYADEDGDSNPAPKSEPKQQAKPQPTTLVEAAKELGGIVKNSMTVETAEAVTNKDGVRYGDIDTKTLSHMGNAITKAMEKNGMSHEKHEEHQLKLDAIKVILESRQ